MAAKNRVVRVEDDLWEAVRAEAERRNWSLAELVREALTERGRQPSCFHCEQPAAFYGSVPLDEAGGVRVSWYACDDCMNAANDAVMDSGWDAVLGRGLVRDDSRTWGARPVEDLHPAYQAMREALAGKEGRPQEGSRLLAGLD